jgi:plasmid maintenance system antidote protein VapI
MSHSLSVKKEDLEIEKDSVRSWIAETFLSYQKRNASLSLRSFAAACGTSVSTLSGVLNGKRNVTEKTIRKIANRFISDSRQREETVQQLKLKLNRSKTRAESSRSIGIESVHISQNCLERIQRVIAESNTVVPSDRSYSLTLIISRQFKKRTN